MRIELDLKLDFEKVRCEICQREDSDWCVMHFLSDGAWRKLSNGQTLREQGIDELDTTRLYCIHRCTEAVMRTFISLQEINIFLRSLKEQM